MLGYQKKEMRVLLSARLFVPLLLILSLALVFDRPALAQEPTLTGQFRTIAQAAAEGVEAAEQNNLQLMRAEYEEIHTAWESFEDEVREQDPGAYVELEGALQLVQDALQAETPDAAAVRLAYDHLKDEADELAIQFDSRTESDRPTTVKATPADLMQKLDLVDAALERGEVSEAQAQLSSAIQLWPGIEGAIATRSQEAYTAIEINLSRAAAALRSQPANLADAETAIAELRTNLVPFVGRQSYTMFDAAAIILREGLEALLVIVALLAFLRQSGNSHQRGWIWAGGGVGVLASIVTAFFLQTLFSRATAGQNREIIEGAISIIAAGLLFYVSYWLHSKASLHAWQTYIHTRTSRVLMRGSAAGLALLAFLAVFREGAETAVFYLGLAPSIALKDLLLGLGIGTAGLGVVAVLMLGVGVRLPLRLFFRIAGLLVYYLGFKFIGTGIHALQVAGVLPASFIAPLPAFPFVGIYPTWETLIPQLLLLAVTLAAFMYLRAQSRPDQARSSVAST